MPAAPMAGSFWGASGGPPPGWPGASFARWMYWRFPNSAWKPSGESMSRTSRHSSLSTTKATIFTMGWDNALYHRPDRPHRHQRQKRRDGGSLVPTRAGHGAGGFWSAEPYRAEIRRPEDQSPPDRC